MNKPRTPDSAKDAGFTLLELLIVLAILALAMSVALPMIRPSSTLQLQATTRDILRALQLTRTAAIVRRSEMAVYIDTDRRQIESPVIQIQPFGPDIAMELKVAEPERTSRFRGGFRFFPDGSSTGGDVSLSSGNQKTKICVNWLTGGARQMD